MDRQKPIKTLVVSSNLWGWLMVFDPTLSERAQCSRLKSHPQWCLHHLKILTSKIPAYGKKDGETKVGDNDCFTFGAKRRFFTLWGGCPGGVKISFGIFLGACSQGKFRGLSSECSSKHCSPQRVFTFFVSKRIKV